MNRRLCFVPCVCLFLALGLSTNGAVVAAEPVVADGWRLVSTSRNELPTPNAGSQQTCSIVADFDGDGRDDFVVGERTGTPSVVWYGFDGATWRKHTIDDTRLRPEAGGCCLDIDRDGDPDVVLGQDASGGEIWWWENPRPDFSRPWIRRLIKAGGARKHHDQTAADFDGDGHVELVSWNQGAKSLLMYDLPADPRVADAWKPRVIATWDRGAELEGFPTSPIDIDGDGVDDIVGGGRWFTRTADGPFKAHVIDDSLRFTQCAAGQLIEGGRPEIVFTPGDYDGVAKWFSWNGKGWDVHSLGPVRHGHTCEMADIDRDGHVDLLIGEMGQPGAGDEARVIVWFGDGRGGLREEVISRGQGIHEGKLGDFDGDGDLDILLKPYHHNAPRIDLLMQE